MKAWRGELIAVGRSPEQEEAAGKMQGQLTVDARGVRMTAGETKGPGRRDGREKGAGMEP